MKKPINPEVVCHRPPAWLAQAVFYQIYRRAFWIQIVMVSVTTFGVLFQNWIISGILASARCGGGRYLNPRSKMPVTMLRISTRLLRDTDLSRIFGPLFAKPNDEACVFVSIWLPGTPRCITRGSKRRPPVNHTHTQTGMSGQNLRGMLMNQISFEGSPSGMEVTCPISSTSNRL